MLTHVAQTSILALQSYFWLQWHGHWVVGILPLLSCSLTSFCPIPSELVSSDTQISVFWDIENNSAVIQLQSTNSCINSKQFFWQLLCSHIMLWSLSPCKLSCWWKTGAAEAGGDVWETPCSVAAWVCINMKQAWNQIPEEEHLKTKSGLQTCGHSAPDLAARV